MKSVLKAFVRFVMRAVGPVLADDSLRRRRTYGNRARLKISPTAIVNDATFNLISGDISIADHVFFGQGVSVLTGTHDYTKFGAERQHTVPTVGRDIVIKEGAWIASNAIILGPCVIGEHAVIGAGALVTRDVPSYALVAGNPARFIKDVRNSKNDKAVHRADTNVSGGN